MRIAQVAPLHESVPPRLYGGTERVVHYLTEELVRLGHAVTLFASGDSKTSARLEACCGEALRLDPRCQDSVVHHVLMLEKLFQRAHEFDIIHFHVDYLHFPLLRRYDVTSLTTFHWRLDLPDFKPIAAEFTELPVSSISLSQRRPLPGLNWVGNVYHGLSRDALPFTPGPGRYLAFLGRVSPEKGLDQAVEIALRTGRKLRIAAKINDFERDYFDEQIKPLLRSPLVEFLGEICEEEKADFLGNAEALLFPIQWPEPFGLVMIEAMACGTPVIAYPHGSVPEVLRHGVTGYIVDNTDGAVQAVNCLDQLDRRRCREEFESRFTSTHMAKSYLRVYRKLLQQKQSVRETGWKRSSKSRENIMSSPLPL